MQSATVVGCILPLARCAEVLSELESTEIPEGLPDAELKCQQALASSRLEFQEQRPKHDPLVRERFIQQYLVNAKLFQKEVKAEKSHD